MGHLPQNAEILHWQAFVLRRPALSQDDGGLQRVCRTATDLCWTDVSAVPTLTWVLGDIQFQIWLHQPPGFAVLFVSALSRSTAMGVKIKRMAPADSFNRNQIPSVLGYEIDDDEIDIARNVNFAGMYAIAILGGLVDGLYLHPPNVRRGTDDEVEALAVSIGFGHSKAHARRLV